MADGPSRVLHYMSTNVGMTGVETFMLQLTTAQKRLGLSPMLHCEFAQREELIEQAAARDIPAFDLPAMPVFAEAMPQKLRTLVQRTQGVAAIARLLARERVEVLHIHSVGIAGLHGYLAAALRPTPVVVTHHTTLAFAPPRGALGKSTFALEKRFARRVVMPYEAAAREMEAGGLSAAQLRVVPFCVDETRFTLGAPRLASSSEFRLVLVSRVVPDKGHGLLLDAMAALRSRLPFLRLSVVGDGPELPAVKTHVDRLGLGDMVELLGRVPHTEVPGLLQRAHAVVLPSTMHGETFPLCLLEAMALGLPAIGARWSGIPDIITDGATGFVVPPHDAVALAVAIERLASDAAFYRAASERAVARVRDHFTSAAVAAQYSVLYDEARAA